MKKPSPKPKSSSTHEIRVAAQPIGQRLTISRDANGTRTVSGYFATFGTLSHDLGFREVLQRGCFSESLKTQPVACYRDHNPQMLFGKTQSGTLEVSEDSNGLAFRVKLPDTSYANDLIALMERGDAFECSFGFGIKDTQGEEWSQLPNGEILRTITKAVLFEGSILTGPPAAYPNTSANLRSCPPDIRAKLTRSDDDDSDLDCEGVDADDPSCEDEEDRCDCTCDECENGDCDQCSEDDCDSIDCISCPEQTRNAHMQLLIRRL